MIGGITESRVILHVKHHLGNTVAVTHVYKGHATHFSGALHPAGEGNLLSGITKAEFSACFRSIHKNLIWFLICSG